MSNNCLIIDKILLAYKATLFNNFLYLSSYGTLDFDGLASSMTLHIGKVTEERVYTKSIGISQFIKNCALPIFICEDQISLPALYW